MGSLALSRSSSWRKSLELADGSSATAKVKAYEGDWRKALQLCKAGEPQKILSIVDIVMILVRIIEKNVVYRDPLRGMGGWKSRT